MTNIVPFRLRGVDTWFSYKRNPNNTRGENLVIKIVLTRVVVPKIRDILEYPSIEGIYNSLYGGDIPICNFCNKNLCHVDFTFDIDDDGILQFNPLPTEIWKCTDKWCSKTFRKINSNSIEYVSKSHRVSYDEAVRIIHQRNPTPFYFHPELQTEEEYRASQRRDVNWYKQTYGDKADEKIKYKSDNLKLKNSKEYIIQHYGEERANEISASKAQTLEKYIAKYGVEKGTELYNAYKDRCKQTKENFIRRYGVEEGVRRWNEHHNLMSYNNSKQRLIDKYGKEIADKLSKEWHSVTLEKMIKKYGEEEGVKRYKSHLRVTRGELSWYIEQYGEQDGFMKWKARWENLSRNSKLARASGNYGRIQSKVAIEFFTQLRDKLVSEGFEKTDLVFYDGTNDEYRVTIADEQVRTYFLDFYIKSLKLDIEYNGTFWHAKEGLSEDKIRVWNETHNISYSDSLLSDKQRVTNLASVGIDVISVWDDDPDKLNLCLTQILERRQTHETD